jgi:hypothetical protein
MARLVRTVVAGLPHHVTQRGNRRGAIFFEDGDQEVYRDLLAEQARKAAVAGWASLEFLAAELFLSWPYQTWQKRRILRPGDVNGPGHLNREHGRGIMLCGKHSCGRFKLVSKSEGDIAEFTNRLNVLLESAVRRSEMSLRRRFRFPGRTNTQAGFHPRIHITGVKHDHALPNTIHRAAHRQAQLVLPALNGPYAFPCVVGDVFPRRQNSCVRSQNITS